MTSTGSEPVTEPARERSETVTQQRFWPNANRPPKKVGTYVERHPTRYTWRDDVEKRARHLVNNYECWVNTYFDHPEGFRRDRDSFDVWGPAGRGHPLNKALGQTIYNFLLKEKDKIEWIIYRGKRWRPGIGRTPFGTDPFTWHHDHIHVTYRA